MSTPIYRDDADYTGDVTIEGTLAVTGAATFSTTVGISGATTAAGVNPSGLVSGVAAAFTSTLGVSGTATMAAINASGLISGVAAVLSSTLGVSGTATMAGINASGYISGVAGGFSSTFNVTGAADFGSTLDCEVFTGLVPMVALTTTTPATLSSTQLKGHLVTMSQVGTINLPACFVGANATFYSTAANAVSVNPDDNDLIVLDGTPLHDGDKITSASTAGDFVTLVCDTTTGWRVIGRSGTWTDGGA